MEKNNYLNDIFHYCLMAFLFVGTYFYVPVSKEVFEMEGVMFGYAVQELFFRYGTIFLFGLASFMHPKRFFTDKLFIVFMLYTLLSTMAKGFDIDSRRAILNVFFGFIFYKTVVQNFDFKKIKQFGWMFFGLLMLNLVFCGLQFLGKDPLFSSVGLYKAGWKDTLVGMMKLKVHLGVLSAVVAPLMMFVSPWLIIPCIGLLIISQSSAAAIAFLASLILISFHKLPKRTFYLALILICSAFYMYVFKFDMPTGQFGERFQVWFATTTLTLKKDLYFGQGLGTFAGLGVITIQHNSSPQNWIWCHNEFLQLWYESGVFGLLIVVLFIIQNVKALFKYRLKTIINEYVFLLASFISILCVSFLHFPFHLGRFAGVFIFFMALLAAKREDYNY